MLDNNEVIAKLNHLLGTVNDGKKGYREAADEVENTTMKTMFLQYAQQRATLGSELETQIRQLGGEAKEDGSAMAAIHRMWINIREAISKRDDYAIIAEVERGEDVAIDNYRSVMEEDLPADIKAFVSTQYDVVKAAHDEMRDLKHSMEPT